MTSCDFEIRQCRALDELRACVSLQKEVWNFSDAELVPLRLFVVAEKVGGEVLGAFDGTELVGFSLAIPGIRNQQTYLHSHMVAVRDDHRDRGLGRSIKLHQRDSALKRGIDLIEWTYDPLEIKNAYLNIQKLGAISRRYYVNQYGVTSSPLQGGLPSDRLVAEWWLKADRVQAVVAGLPLPICDAEVKIAVPHQIYDWKASQEHHGDARAVQDRNRELFLTSFDRGFAVLGYSRDGAGNGTFLLGPWNEPSR